MKKLAILLTTGMMMPMGGISQSYAQSNIKLDGTTGAGAGLGQDFSGNAGPQTIILDGGGSDRHGTVNGNNLFFSFNQFGIASGDTAQFQCTDCAALTNVISRVTGNASSIIDGTLRSDIPNANFWFFNPNGVVFGAGSVVDVPAALHVSSGNLLNFGSSQFDVNTDLTSSSLSFAEPTSFGFANSGDITVSGTSVIAGGAVEIAAANSLTINNNNTIYTPSAASLTANNSGVLSTTNVADIAIVTNSAGGTLNLSSPGEIVVGANAIFNGSVGSGGAITNNGSIGNASSGGAIANNGSIGNASSGGAITNNGNIGNASSGGVLTNNGNINGSAHAAVDVFNTNTANITDGVSADRNVNNSGHIWGGSVTAGQDITNTGAIILNKSGVVNLNAGQNLINTGDGVNTGIIQINHDTGNETIHAGYDLVLGQDAGKGLIQKQNGAGNLTITGGNHAFLLNNSGSRIEDNSTQGGNLTVNVPAGNLDLAAGNLISKSGDGTGQLILNVQAGNLITHSGARIDAVKPGQNHLITVSGAIDNSGELTAEQVHASAGLVNQAGAAINGDASSGQAMTNNGVINGNARAESGLSNAGTITENAFSNTGDLQTTGTIFGKAQAAAGSLINAGNIGGHATAGINLTNQATGRVDGSAQANQSLTNAGIINHNATAFAGELINSGTIAGDAEASTGNLSNTAAINGSAKAGSNLTNTGNIGLDATAVNGNIQNSGQINRDAEAGNDLTNQANAVINGFANAHQTLTNAGIIIQNATAGTNLVNQGNIGKDAVAGIDLDNQASGVITGNAKADQQLSNAGYINQSATAGTTLVNNGRIGLNAFSAGNLTNNNTINGNATAEINLYNSGVIDKDAIAKGGIIDNKSSGLIKGTVSADQGLINAGTISLTAKSTHGQLINSGTIDMNASADDGDLKNTGTILGSADSGGNLTNQGAIGSGANSGGDLDNQASGHITGNVISKRGQLSNNGVINGDASTGSGDLNNAGTITGAADSADNLTNQASGNISNGATAVGNLTNYGVIEGANITAGQDLQVRGSAAVVNLTGTNPVEMRAYQNLTIEKGAKVNVTNIGDACILAGKNLNVTDNNTKISANNSGAMVISSGKPPTGGNIKLTNYAEITKSLGTDLQIVAYKSLGRAIQLDAGGKIIIDKGGKLIADQPKGTLFIAAEGTAALGQIKSNGTFKANDQTLYGLQIASGGSVKTMNKVNLSVVAQTVYLQGDGAVSGEKGTMSFKNPNAGSINLIVQPQQFKIKNSSIINKGAITLDNYYLDMQGDDQVASGIKSSSIINLKLSNLATLSTPRLVAGVGAKNKAERVNGLTNYLDGKLTKESTNINEIIQTVTSASSTIVAKPSTNPGLPKNPCESRNGLSTLNTNTPGTYQPGANAQLPYSILSTTSVVKPATIIPTASVPSAPLAKSDEC